MTTKMLSKDQFLAVSSHEQAEFLANLARAALPVLARFSDAHHVAKSSVERIETYLEKGGAAMEAALHLNHPNVNLDLSAIYDFVDEDETALDAIEVVVYATGLVGRMAYQSEGADHMPDTISSATPDVAANAINHFQNLVDRGAV